MFARLIAHFSARKTHSKYAIYVFVRWLVAAFFIYSAISYYKVHLCMNYIRFSETALRRVRDLIYIYFPKYIPTRVLLP